MFRETQETGYHYRQQAEEKDQNKSRTPSKVDSDQAVNTITGGRSGQERQSGLETTQ